MKNSIELQQLGKELAKKYISESADLTETLIKVGEANGLNSDELERVAEVANVETYLGLFDKREDKYIDFPLADSAEAYKGVVKTATPAIVKNYENQYEDVDRAFSFSMYDPSFSYEEKSDVDITSLTKQASKLQNIASYLGDQFSEEVANFNKTIDNIFNLSKQAGLSGTPLSDIKGIYKMASEKLEPVLTTNLITKLSSNTEFMNQLDTEKYAELTQLPNPNSELYKEVEAAEKQYNRLEKIAAGFFTYKDKYNWLVAQHNDLHITNDFKKTGSAVKGFFALMKQYPKTSLAVGLGGLGTAGLATKIVSDTKDKIDKRYEVNNFRKENIADLLRKQRQGV